MDTSIGSSGANNWSWEFVAMAVACTLFFATTTSAIDGCRVQRVRHILEGHPTKTVRVQEGDTIWNLAQGCRVDGVSTSDIVSWLYEHNGLTTACLTPGQPLSVPM